MPPEVLIAGGGIIGCSIAWRLAQSGVRVEIADAGRLGGQASWAGAGMLAPGGEVDRDSPWGRRSIQSLRLYPGFVRELREESGLPIDLRLCGALELAYTEWESSEIDRKAAQQALLGIESTVVDAREAREIVPELDVEGLAGARYYPADGLVDPRQIMAALAKVLGERGANLREFTTLLELDPDRPTVLAAGAWSCALLPEAPRSYPVKGHLIGYDLRPSSVPAILRHGHSYVLQRSSGFTVAGSTTENVGFDTSTDAHIVARLHERARRYLPGLLHASPDASWTGLRPAVEGETPLAERWRDTQIWLAYGHYRNGILLAPVTAELIANGITASSGTD